MVAAQYEMSAPGRTFCKPPNANVKEFSLDMALRAPGRPVVLVKSAVITWGELWSSANSLARELPPAPAVVNLCERREQFLTVFLALLIRGQECLLPPARAPAVVSEVLAEHPGSYSFDEAVRSAIRADETAPAARAIEVPPQRVVVVGYTSGSTGRPTANPKKWGSLLASARLNSTALRGALAGQGATGMPWILATVPSQHMYGMETSVLLPLLADMGLHAAHPLFPADIATALAELPEPRILVTTPVHLRALLESGIDLPPLAVVVSATAPLTPEMARRVEQRYGAALVEFFGSTETCVIASRRTAQEAAWHPYPGVSLRPGVSGTEVGAPWFQTPVLLQDVLEVHSDGTFVVRGRNADMVEVGGKRASLADLTRRLLAVPGVRDGVVFQPDRTDGAAVQRLAALVVAEGLSESEVLEQLAPGMDPVFLPRPLVFVSRLPRNDVGKLPRETLLAALER
jgi:acyl-coenzyme A synthetase/AMP-(fatty) acid ligase